MLHFKKRMAKDDSITLNSVTGQWPIHPDQKLGNPHSFGTSTLNDLVVSQSTQTYKLVEGN